MLWYLCTENTDKCFPVRDDISLNNETHEMLTSIEEVMIATSIKNIYMYVCIYIDVYRYISEGGHSLHAAKNNF